MRVKCVLRNFMRARYIYSAQQERVYVRLHQIQATCAYSYLKYQTHAKN